MPAFSICNGDLFYSPLPPSIAARLGVFARLLIEPEARCSAPGELGERRGVFSFGGFSLDKQRKVTCRGSVTHKLYVAAGDTIIYKYCARYAGMRSSSQ